MPSLVDAVVAPLPYVVDQAEAAAFAHKHFGAGIPNIDRFMPVFVNTGIKARHFCQPPEWYASDHDPSERNRAFIEIATERCATAARELLHRQSLQPSDIDRIYFINTTGLATPSIDARLINVLGLNRNVRRTPVWGLGCAGGVAGLSLAAHELHGYPRARALVFAAELCSLTFLRDDHSTSNLIATALFADGAAVALVSGDETGDTGYPIVGSRSTLFPDSLDIMGWNVVSRGLQVVFDRRIPALIREHGASELDHLLVQRGLCRDDIAEFLYHPGGPRVLQAYADAYGIDMDRFSYSRDVLAECGNMSSVTVLYVLARYIATHRPGQRGFAVAAALGPGFSSEAVLLAI